MKKAIVLLSGGIDTATVLAIALNQGRTCVALSFDYNQRHLIELQFAQALAQHYGIPHKIIKIEPSSFANSALVSRDSLPTNRSTEEIKKGGIPSTYVPGRNTLFLSYAMAQAEILEAEEIYHGANALDISAYPDCRPEFMEAFQQVMNLATKAALEGKAPRLMAPLIKWNKAEIIRCALELQVPLEKTHSCYDPQGQQACGCCDACMLRLEGFAALGIKDPSIR